RQLAAIAHDAPPEKRAVIEAIAPGRDAEFRVVARLRLTGPRRGVVLDLVAWRARSGQLCTVTLARTAGEPDIGGAGPNGPCVPVNRCRILCVEQGQIEVGERGSTIVAGTVGSDADELRLALLGGGERRVPLDGPFLPGDPRRRAVLLDLGRASYTHVELRRDGRVVERREAESAYDYATEDCIERALAQNRDPAEDNCF
nr:hypothetical protein [Actinomycetota bacterium]